MKMVALIIMVAVVLEGLVEYGKTIWKMIEEGQYKTAVTQAVTIALGLFLAFSFHLELFNVAVAEVYEGLSINPVLDGVLTGILISRGSNYASDFIGLLTKKNIDAEALAIAEDGVEDFEFPEEADDGIIDEEEEESIF